MTFPPPALPTNRTNATARQDTHPGDHNAANAAINDLTTEAVARGQTIDAHVSTALSTASPDIWQSNFFATSLTFTTFPTASYLIRSGILDYWCNGTVATGTPAGTGVIQVEPDAIPPASTPFTRANASVVMIGRFRYSGGGFSTTGIMVYISQTRWSLYQNDGTPFTRQMVTGDVLQFHVSYPTTAPGS